MLRQKKRDYLIFGNPEIKSAEIREMIDTLKSGWIGTGPKTEKFQDLFRKYKGSKYAIALNSGTAALHLSIEALNLPKDSEIITTPLTFGATVNAIIHAGAKPVFVDCQKDTMNIDADLIEEKITKRTKAILPVHFAGRPSAMDKIVKISHKYGLCIIEDCAHAIEAEYNGEKTGTFGKSGCFSFYVTKNLVTGEGGMVITNDKDYANRIKILALHGLSKDAWMRFSDNGYKHYEYVCAGYKCNMTDMQASLGIHQLNRLEDNWKKRKRIWQRYNDAFKDLPLILPKPTNKHERHAHHLYTLLIDDKKTDMKRDKLIRLLHNEGIGTGVHYIALHLHKYYQKTLGVKKGDFPNAEYISERTFSIPLSSKLSFKDINRVVSALHTIFKAKGKK